MKYQIAVVSDVGNVRKKNEDSLLVCRKFFGGQEVVLAAVADGMGGLSGGEWASRCVVSCLQDWWKEQVVQKETPPVLKQAGEWLGYALENAQEQIQREIRSRRVEMGTTVTVLYLYKEQFVILQVGDSRAYLFSKEAVQLTVDQTWCQEEMEAGRMTPEQAQNHARRHVLSNALGAGNEFYFKKTAGSIKSGQRILLCTDGYYNYLKAEELKPGRFAPEVEKALLFSGERIKKGKAEDNFTAVLIEAR